MYNLDREVIQSWPMGDFDAVLRSPLNERCMSMLKPRHLGMIAIGVIAIVAICMCVAFAVGFDRCRYRDAVSQSGVTYSLRGLPLGHDGWPTWISLCGYRIESPRGDFPYYLKMPNTDVLVAVENVAGQLADVHVVRCDTHQHVIVPIGLSSFGTNIGGAQSAEYRSYVAQLDGTVLVLAEEVRGRRTCTVIDLHNATLISYGTDCRDAPFP